MMYIYRARGQHRCHCQGDRSQPGVCTAAGLLSPARHQNIPKVRQCQQDLSDKATHTLKLPVSDAWTSTLVCIHRWKDTLLGCFKAGRYRHLLNTHVKINGKNVYRLVMPLAHDAQTQQK